ncbi:hypothetical protein L0Y81_30000 (plasmid) [Burkholderia multivorans]|uniref:Uncharacterized protein n=2 Tax=Burkholderia multivorans TaxID=87883 RepID=A0A0H3KRP2_BURM1|nr:hypothetical protein [Burkholderia multivorans]EGD06675.1 hypothetical protein B1M_00160 [Burkholderia sp. TJI49]ELK7722858.1 hypothetical protein [Burkholderia cenocepacia]ABX19852.1 hypothetical protein Bmul_6199 [Burkholderia multivorans ATCC 17616]MBR8048896.1 hypothetical protein [Burkholderia multivorans]MBR8453320.1 hypothetical protein [Burkholderia multivorans]
MQIPCTITREHYADIDRAGRSYTLEFVHYAHAETGNRVRTKAHIIPTVEPFNREPDAPECQLTGTDPARPTTRSSVYLDANENPAIRLSFGYSHQTRATTQVLAVERGRVVTQWMTQEQFDAEYAESDVPPLVAAHALMNIGRTGGIDPTAHRYLLFALNAPAWRLALNAYGAVARNWIRRTTQQLY